MQDIGIILNNKIQEEQCSPLQALLLLIEREEDKKNGIHILQPEPSEQPGRGLRNKSDF